MDLDVREVRQITDAAEVLAIIVPSFFLTVICTNLSATFIEGTRNANVKNFCLDFTLLVVPVVLSCTLLADYVGFINIMAFGIVILVTWLHRTRINRKKEAGDTNETMNIQYLSSTRSIINLLTVVCILGVDFEFFPHRFSKTAYYGVSLMDVGVGLYVYANGIVAYEIRGVQHSLRTTFINVLPILAIGIARFVCTSFTGYPVNPKEYGIHWNFFITLAVTKLISAVIMTRIVAKFETCLALGVGIVTLHQAILFIGVEEYIQRDMERVNFIAANREGIGSSLGYVGLYFMSVATGFVLQNAKNKRRIYITMIIGIGILVVLTSVLLRLFNISRCMANSTYVVWILFIAYFMTFLLFCHEEFLRHFYPHRSAVVYTPQLFKAVNYNGLTYFLIANLITGCINLTIDTHNVGDAVAMLIMLLYMLVCSLIVVFLYHKKIKLKL